MTAHLVARLLPLAMAVAIAPGCVSEEERLERAAGGKAALTDLIVRVDAAPGGQRPGLTRPHAGYGEPRSPPDPLAYTKGRR
jgi:hypothetical protein